MKILLVTGIYRPDIGGPATFIPILAQYLMNEANNIEVLTLKDKSSKIEPELWPVIRVSRDQLLIFRFLRTFFILCKRFKKNDLVFANGLFEQTALVLFFRRKKSIAKVVGDDVWHRALNRGATNLSLIEFNESTLKFYDKIQRSFLVWSLNRFDEITCPSQQLEKIIRKWGVRRPISVIHNGVAIIKCKKQIKHFDLVTVSRLIPLKNIDKIIRIASDSGAKLAVIGDGPKEDELKTYAKFLDADVTFMGSLNNTQVMKILCQSRIFMLLSDHEGLSFSLLEAMAARLTPIVSNITGNTAVVTDMDTGLVVDATNHIKNVSVVKNLLKSPLILQKFGESAAAKVTHDYSQKNQIGKIIELISHVYFK